LSLDNKINADGDCFNVQEAKTESPQWRGVESLPGSKNVACIVSADSKNLRGPEDSRLYLVGRTTEKKESR